MKDEYIAKKIQDESKKGRVLAVVGVGHVKGIKTKLEKGELKTDLKDLEQVPKKRIKISKVVAYAIPVLFVGLILWLIYTRGPDAWADIKDVLIYKN